MYRRLERATVAAVALVVMNAGCGGASPTSPIEAPTTPVTPLTSLSVSSVSPDIGPINGDVEVRITGVGFLAGATALIGDVPALVTDVKPSVVVAIVPPHAAGTVDVAVTNPDGQTARRQRGYTFAVFSLTASPAIAAAGDLLTVSWVAPDGRGCNGGGDWIAIYKAGAPDITGASNGHSDLWYDHVCGATSGSRALSAPDQPGDYEFRFMVGDTSVARSGTISVRAR
jgi:hypothetical protein